MELILPQTIREPYDEEFPPGTKLAKIKKEKANARLVPGYTVNFTDDYELFTFFSEINVDLPNLWTTFMELAKLLPPKVTGVVNIIDEDPIFSIEKSKSSLLKIYKDYLFELCNDSYLEFGLVYQDDERLIEVFVTSFKFIRFWGQNFTRFKNKMKQLKLTEVKDLNFIDEFPHKLLPLAQFYPEARKPKQILKKIEHEYNFCEN